MSIKEKLKLIIPAPLLEVRAFINRQRQSRKTAREIFSEVYRKKLWDEYGATNDFFSGFGSHNREIVEAYISALEPILRQMPGARITDLGCGDFNIGSKIRRLCGPYIACDVVPELIERNRITFLDLAVDFRCLDITTDQIPPGDIAIVRQVLQHLNNAQISRFLKQVDGYKVLVVTEHLPSGNFQPNIDKATGGGVRVHGLRPSGVVLSAPPFNLKFASEQVLADAPDGNDLIRTTAYYF